MSEAPSVKMTLHDKTTETSPTESYELDWTDPQNKANPHNWGVLKKLIHTALPCFLSFTITFSTSTTVPATPIIAQYFNVTSTQSILVLTLFTIGVAIGPLVTAPLSEEFGRKPVYLITHLLLLLFTLGAALTSTLSGLLICRLLAGLFGSAGLSIGAGTVSDIWDNKARGRAALFFILGPFIGPALGPIAGAYLLYTYDNDWRWTQYIILMLGLPILLLLFVSGETHHSILQKRLQGSTIAETSELRRVLELTKIAVRRPVRMLFTEPIVFLLTLYTAYAYAMVFAYFASQSYILQSLYSFDSRQVGLALIPILVGYVLASAMFGVFDMTLYSAAAKKSATGIAAPEHRLYSALAGSIMIPIGLFWYAWEAHKGGHWAALITSGIPFGFGAFSLFLSTVGYLVEIYQSRAAASALAANGLLRYILGAVFPLFTLQMYQKLGIHWASSLFAFLSLALLPVPWVLFWYGPKLRAKARI